MNKNLVKTQLHRYVRIDLSWRNRRRLICISRKLHVPRSLHVRTFLKAHQVCTDFSGVFVIYVVKIRTNGGECWGRAKIVIVLVRNDGICGNKWKRRNDALPTNPLGCWCVSDFSVFGFRLVIVLEKNVRAYNVRVARLIHLVKYAWHENYIIYIWHTVHAEQHGRCSGDAATYMLHIYSHVPRHVNPSQLTFQFLLVAARVNA